MKKLQDISKEHVKKAAAARDASGELNLGKGHEEDQPWEWRAWDRMYARERAKAYESLQVWKTFSGILYTALMGLQKSKKAYERGEALRQFKSATGQIVSLVDDEEDKKPVMALGAGRVRDGGAVVKSQLPPIKREGSPEKLEASPVSDDAGADGFMNPAFSLRQAPENPPSGK